MVVEKKEGATMKCNTCKTELVCHMSAYKGDYENKLQWQNPDGKPHYKYDNGEYKCVMPGPLFEGTTTTSTNTSYKSNKIPIEKAEEVFAKSLSLIAMFRENSSTLQPEYVKAGAIESESKETPLVLPIEVEAQLAMSFFKTIMGSCKVD